jgi:hypothetical protein
MDILKLVKALSDSELVELQESVIMERIRRFNTSKFPPLNEEELKLFES